MALNEEYCKLVAVSEYHKIRETKKAKTKMWFIDNIFNLVNSLGVIVAIVISIFALIKS